MIDARGKDGKKVCEESRMFLEVKVESAIVYLEIGRLDDDLFERIMFLISV